MKAEYDFSKARRGAIAPQRGKTRITIFIDDATLDEFRARAERHGTGYQTLINEALRQHVAAGSEQPLTERVLRHVLRQEMPVYLRAAAPKAAKAPRKRAAGGSS